MRRKGCRTVCSPWSWNGTRMNMSNYQGLRSGLIFLQTWYQTINLNFYLYSYLIMILYNMWIRKYINDWCCMWHSREFHIHMYSTLPPRVIQILYKSRWLFFRDARKTQNICITFVQRRPNVFHVGPTLYKCYTNVLYLLGHYFEDGWRKRIAMVTMVTVCWFEVLSLATSIPEFQDLRCRDNEGRPGDFPVTLCFQGLWFCEFL